MMVSNVISKQHQPHSHSSPFTPSKTSLNEQVSHVQWRASHIIMSGQVREYNNWHSTIARLGQSETCNSLCFSSLCLGPSGVLLLCCVCVWVWESGLLENICSFEERLNACPRVGRSWQDEWQYKIEKRRGSNMVDNRTSIYEDTLVSFFFFFSFSGLHFWPPWYKSLSLRLGLHLVLCPSLPSYIHSR